MAGLHGRMDMGAYAMLKTPTQVSGTATADTLTVRFATPIAKMMLGTPAVMGLMQEQLRAIAGHEMRIVFTEGGPDGQPVKPDMAKLEALSKFGNIKFE